MFHFTIIHSYTIIILELNFYYSLYYKYKYIIILNLYYCLLLFFLNSLNLNIIGNDVKHIIKGTFRNGSQYHFTMETQTCVCVPIEDGIDVFAATQWMDLTQVAIAQCLNIKNNR